MGKRNKLGTEQQSLVLNLRYAVHPGQGSLKIMLSYAAISRLTDIPVSTVRCLCLRFERRRSDAEHSDSGAGAEKDGKAAYDLQQAHVDYLCAESTLKSWVSRSIQERSVLFHRRFPDKFIKPWRLRFIYKQNLIKPKAINIAKMPIKSQDGRYGPLFDAMRQRLQAAYDEQRKVIWLDETMFTKSANATHEWSQRKHNFTLPCESLGAKYTAVCAAISEGCGFECFTLYSEAVNQEYFIAFLERLAEINPGRRLAIVMDNLAAHKTAAVKERMRELDIAWIWVVPYSPQYNAIELPFGQIKKRFRESKL